MRLTGQIGAHRRHLLLGTVAIAMSALLLVTLIYRNATDESDAPEFGHQLSEQTPTTLSISPTPAVTGTPAVQHVQKPDMPAGAGRLREYTGNLVVLCRTCLFRSPVWTATKADYRIDVFGGAQTIDPIASEVLILSAFQGCSSPPACFAVYHAPKQVGPLTIVGASADTVQLVSPGGDTFYFDTITRTFVDRLPTATGTNSDGTAQGQVTPAGGEYFKPPIVDSALHQTKLTFNVTSLEIVPGETVTVSLMASGLPEGVSAVQFSVPSFNSPIIAVECAGSFERAILIGPYRWNIVGPTGTAAGCVLPASLNAKDGEVMRITIRYSGFSDIDSIRFADQTYRNSSYFATHNNEIVVPELGSLKLITCSHDNC